jgi:hypothetical protein
VPLLEPVTTIAPAASVPGPRNVIVVFGDAVGVPGIGNALIEPVASNAAGRGVGSGRAEVGTGGVVVVVDAAPALGAANQPTAPTESVPTSAARPRR